METLPLLRPSQLARFWELHPKTIYLWIREGRLPAVRTPGDQFRLRAADVRAFCEARGMPLPPFATQNARRAFVAAASPAGLRVVKRALKLHLESGVTLSAYPAAIDAILACAIDPPSLLILDGAARGVAMDDAVRALARSARASRLAILVFNIASVAKADAIASAGAAAAILRGKDREIATAIDRILA